MQPTSHIEPINTSAEAAKHEVFLLADAFSEFIAASSRLEASYATLQHEVTHLSHELADRNSALKVSLAENERVHAALQQIVDSMPCGVLVVEGDGVVSMINPEGLRLLDLGPESEGHLDLVSAASGVDLAGFLRRSNGTEDEQEFCRVSAGGRRWLAVHDRRLLTGSESQQTILILRDVTPHKQAEQERERARKSIALSEVATTLAHEIRNPLTSLELFAGLIAEGGEESAEWISHLRAGIRLLGGTVNNVLSFHGAGFPALVALDLSQSIGSSVEFVRPIAEQNGVFLEFHTDGPLMVRGNSSALQQIVSNIVCNAIRHTPKGGLVSVSVYESESVPQAAVIEFSDTGHGIALDQIEKIFQPGFSGSGATSGLGLAVCEQIVRQHEGRIRVVSEVNAGTTFYVEIPAE